MGVGVYACLPPPTSHLVSLPGQHVGAYASHLAPPFPSPHSCPKWSLPPRVCHAAPTWTTTRQHEAACGIYQEGVAFLHGGGDACLPPPTCTILFKALSLPGQHGGASPRTTLFNALSLPGQHGGACPPPPAPPCSMPLASLASMGVHPPAPPCSRPLVSLASTGVHPPAPPCSMPFVSLASMGVHAPLLPHHLFQGP